MTPKNELCGQFRILVNPTQRVCLGKTFRVVFLAMMLFALTAAALAPRTILFLGDSITAGYGLELSQAYPALIEQWIKKKDWNFRVVNAGQSGDTSAGGLGRMDWLLKNKIDVLVLELGGNDGLRGLPVEVTRKNLQAIIDRAKERYPRVQIVIAGMRVPPNMGAHYSQEFEAMFGSLAKKNDAVLIPFILEGVGGVRQMNLSDGIHPTANGHEIVAANVWKVLEPVLRSIQSR
ncbi:MAG: arylesterase [Deltaproteobacteria bacterium]|nr:arylesterase [Deltaproteobacteria bacterium]